MSRQTLLNGQILEVANIEYLEKIMFQETNEIHPV